MQLMLVHLVIFDYHFLFLFNWPSFFRVTRIHVLGWVFKS